MKSIKTGMAIVVAALAFSSTVASAASIEIGQAFSGVLAPYIDAAVNGIIALLVGTVLAFGTKYLGWKMDDSARAALTTWLERQAHSLVAKGEVKLNGVQIGVNNAALAQAADTAVNAIPDALNRFNLTPDRIQKMIADYIPKVESVAKAQAVALDAANPATPSQPVAT